MTLEEALNTIEVLKLENKKLQSRVDFLEDLVYNDVNNNHEIEYEGEYEDVFDPELDRYR